MNLLRTILLLTLCFALFPSKAQQSTTKNTTQGSDFLIDPSKPYVYLELDHVGPRKPLRASEPNIGLWLRLKNNCTLPIVIVAAFETSLRNPQEATMVMDEVVGDPHGPGGDAMGGVYGTPHGMEEMTDIVRIPNRNEDEVRSAEKAQREDPAEKEHRARPYGYNGGYEPLAPTLTMIPPGGQIIFSLPLNHVGKTWHFEIPFRLALPNKGRTRPPYSYVAFYQEDLKNSHGNAAPPTPTTR
jgi:hypothetical protein